eukprot:gene7030-7819_t
MERMSSLARELAEGVQDNEASNEEPRGGYDADMFTDLVDDDFKSAEQADRSPTCPNDREEISKDKMYPDNSCKRKIMGLKVSCENANLGCEWNSELSNLEGHNKNCLYETEFCTFEGCHETFLRKYKQEHENDCEWRLVKCDYCLEEFRSFQLQEHKTTTCPCQPTQCPNVGCSIIISKKLLEQHVVDDCLFVSQSCPLEFLGCKKQSNRKLMNEHVQEYSLHHIGLLCNELKMLRTKLDAANEKLAKSQAASDQLSFVCADQMLSYIHGFNLYRSQTYATGTQGYYFQIVVFRCHDDIAISLEIVPGLFDDFLPWPFRSNFSIHLLDQTAEEVKRHLSYKYDCNIDNPDVSFLMKPSQQQRQSFPRQMLVVPMSEFAVVNSRYIANNKHKVLVKIQAFNAEINLGEDQDL